MHCRDEGGGGFGAAAASGGVRGVDSRVIFNERAGVDRRELGFRF